ncbi:MAG TPA: VTT domain-containing protein [Puia sp.]|nr:VTT domain-containing protein [Puia sp.]
MKNPLSGLDHIINLLTHYGYIALFALAIIEGPMLAVIAGFLCSMGFLNPLLALPIIVLGDIIGDSLCYMFGRFGLPRIVKRIAIWLGVSREKINMAKTYFKANQIKTISISKVILGIGPAGIYLAGQAKVPYQRFILICVTTSALQYIIYLFIGFLFGNAYARINQYLNAFASFTIVFSFALILIFFTSSKIKKL